MKKTLNINLGGIAFIIDENAFEILFNYLETLKKKFGNEAERKEILNDIESRIAEMFNERLENRKEVVGIEDVEYVIAQMGKPEDIAGEDTSESGNTDKGSTYATTQQPIKKRLYRDPDDAKIGGVIAGLCHYFGINDPVWLRIAAVVLIPITSGSIIFVYLLLLIIIPKAVTAAEKLQMKGEPVNINTIEKEVKEAANRFSDTVSSIDSGNFFQKLWSIVAMLAGMLFRLLAFIFILAGVFALFGVLLTFIVFAFIGTSPFNNLTHLLVDDSSLITLSSIGFLLFFGAPLVGLIYGGLRVLVGRGSKMPWVKWVLGTAWLAGLFILLYGVVKVGREFKTGATTKDNMVLMQPAGGNLFVQLADSTEAGWVTAHDENDSDEEDATHFGTIVIDGKDISEINSFKIGKPHLELMPSENDSFYLQRVVQSQGRNKSEAIKNANLVQYSFRQSDSLLNLKEHFEIAKKGGKYRAQEMTLRIAIPEGKTVSFGNNIDEWTAVVKGDNYYDDTYFANTTWTVMNGKVKCLDCEGKEIQVVKIEKHIEKIDQKLEEATKKMEEKLKQADAKLKETEQKMKEKSGKPGNNF